MGSILEEAQEIIYGARNETYGHPRDQFALAARLWSDYLGVEITAEDHAAMMVLLKLSRVKTGGYHRDAAVDIAGYAGTMERLQEPVVGPFPPNSGDYPVPSTWTENGRRYWANWNDIPHGTRVNSADEPDGYVAWNMDGPGEGWGEGPWREAAYQEDDE